MDLLETLLPSFSSLNMKIKTNGRDNNCNLKKDFEYNANILNEIVDNLVNISNKHFVIVSYNDINNLAERSIVSKFKNIAEINNQDSVVKGMEKDKVKLLIKIKSNNYNTSNEIICQI